MDYDDSEEERGGLSEFAQDVLDSLSDVDPDFLKRNKGENETESSDKKGDSNTEGTKSPVGEAKEKEAKPSKSSKEGGLYKPGKAGASGEGSSRGRGFFKGRGENKNDGKGKKKGGMLKKMRAPAAIGVVTAATGFGALMSLVAAPAFLVGSFDFNLQNSLGFGDTVALLEEEGKTVTGEMLAEGRIPKEYAERLMANNVEVGQITVAGNFVPTNVYIANIEDLGEVAAITDDYQVQKGEGSLAIRFKDRIIEASEFLAEVESDPELHKAYEEAANLPALYYYSDDVNTVYNDMEISRNNFYNWKATGDAKADEESYLEMLSGALNKSSDPSMGFCGNSSTSTKTDDEGNETTTFTADCSEVKSSGDAQLIVDELSTMATGDDATKKAAEVLNAALSAEDPYKAATAFVAIEESLQRTRIEGEGPANETMNVLSTPTEVKYRDVNTGEEKTTNYSILNTPNIAATVGNSGYSISEADNFSRDRTLIATGVSGEVDTSETMVGADAGSSSSVIKNGFGAQADAGIMSNAEDIIEMSLIMDGSELLQSEVGGNQIVEGGAFLSNEINQKVIGSMPADAETIAEYQQDIAKVIAKKAEADRATRSPFDISSPNTFLGSIVHELAGIQLKNYSQNSSPIMIAVGTMAKVTTDSVNKFANNSMADGNGGSYANTHGRCTTVANAGVDGDIYCNEQTANTMKYIKYTMSDWKNSAISGDLTDSGDIKDDTKFKDFVLYGMERDATVGVKSSEMCKRWKEKHPNIFVNLADAVAGFVGTYQACEEFGADIDPGVSIGLGYTMSDSNAEKGNIELYAGYTLYNAVYSLLDGRINSTAKIKNEYYKEHPKDNSPAGRIARISGLSKEDAQLAIDYAAYLTVIANYDASTRFAFGKAKIDRGQNSLVGHKKKVESELYALWSGRAKYADVRNRTFAV